MSCTQGGKKSGVIYKNKLLTSLLFSFPRSNAKKHNYLLRTCFLSLTDSISPLWFSFVGDLHDKLGMNWCSILGATSEPLSMQNSPCLIAVLRPHFSLDLSFVVVIYTSSKDTPNPKKHASALAIQLKRQKRERHIKRWIFVTCHGSPLSFVKDMLVDL